LNTNSNLAPKQPSTKYDYIAIFIHNGLTKIKSHG
jgi:hypothetical protein